MRWVTFLSLLIAFPLSNTLNTDSSTSTNFTFPAYISYKIEVWLFLVLFSILIVVIYRKKLGNSNVTVENKTIGGSSKGKNYSQADFSENNVTEVPIEIPNMVDFSHDKIEGDIKSDKIETNVDTADLAKKLKKLKK